MDASVAITPVNLRSPSQNNYNQILNQNRITTLESYNLNFPLDVNLKYQHNDALREKVLDMSEAQLQAHWNRIKHINGDTAPREVSSEHLILRLIQRDRGAFSLLPKRSIDPQSPYTRILFTY